MNVMVRVLWRLRYDLLAVGLVAAAMAVAVDHISLQSVSGVIPLLGIVVAIFIGFRNRNAYARWWEARTLWSSLISNSRSLNYALAAYEDGTPDMAVITDRMRRREVRHAWRLAAELRGDRPAPGDETATELLTRQAGDIRRLSLAGLIDRQARRVLVTLNSAQVLAAAGLERIRSQPVPRIYDLFTRSLAWLFAIVVCTRMDVGGHDSAVGIVLSLLIMALVIVAERLGALLEAPMSDDGLGLPLDQFCSELSVDLMPAAAAEGSVSHPRESEGLR